MKIVISGASGFLGRRLSQHFIEKGHDVSPLMRVDVDTPSETVAEVLNDAAIIINLAGANVAKRWTEEYKQELFDSRVITTGKIVEAIRLLEKKPRLLISASAVGIYAFGQTHTENSGFYADNFLSEICRAWEESAKAVNPRVRLAITRFGVILDTNEGALARMLPMFERDLGAVIGSGKQGFPWIHIDDAIAAIDFIIENKSMEGAINLCAPECSDNRQFSKELATALKKRLFLRVPVWALKIVMGEAHIVLTEGAFVEPQKLNESKFEYRFPNLKTAFADLLRVTEQ